ncbi:nitric oxide reductase activation protein NorD [Roseicella sp. DB1501]|uniref:nitric oxide reductase activation protein NorD n=1 Tax=Roseicella sp. DB1501 TaxID=2730925 RepID=UPI001490A609|nr:VWA domain-containing protein [Roseicella sp. DB1501]NOG74135.1 VWA domain-containing protein [Roseicella sp. DB1501]
MGWSFEPEESVGQHWHRLVGGAHSWPHHPAAAVRLDEVRTRLGILFRALGGPGGVQLAAGEASLSRHRLGLRARLGLGDAERLDIARFDGATLHLPPVIDLLSDRAANGALYEWLTAWFAVAQAPLPPGPDPLRRDAGRLRAARAQTARLLAALPGLRPLHHDLAAALLAARPARRLSGDEAAVEAAVRASLGDPSPLPPAAAALLDPDVPLDGVRAGRGYRPFLPVPLWGEVEAPAPSAAREAAGQEESSGAAAEAGGRRRRARRREADQARRRDPLLLNRFETIFGLAEMMNLARAVEDDDEAGARQAAEDLDEIGIGEHQRHAATRLRMELDLPPILAAEGALAAAPESFTYPEWDHRSGRYRPAHCRVLAEPAPEDALPGEDWRPDEAAQRRIRRVRRQFEALRPRRQLLHGQPDGEEFDLSALVRSLADCRAGAPGTDRVHSATRSLRRDLSVLVLVDVSLSTDAWVSDWRVLDVEREALLALVGGLDACGDEHAVLTFTSRRRDAVWLRMVKDFDERLAAPVVRRIRALRPGHYTRMGAAVRHAAHLLAQRPRSHRLLLLLTDGKPNDADHYEGRYAIEDTRMAIREARRAGCKVFGITVDREARDYVPYLFGPGGYAIFPDIGRLPMALPAIYRQVTG